MNTESPMRVSGYHLKEEPIPAVLEKDKINYLENKRCKVHWATGEEVLGCKPRAS